MDKITNEKDLLAHSEHCAECLRKKFACEKGHRAIVVCGDTGCLSLNSKEILE